MTSSVSIKFINIFLKLLGFHWKSLWALKEWKTIKIKMQLSVKFSTLQLWKSESHWEKFLHHWKCWTIIESLRACDDDSSSQSSSNKRKEKFSRERKNNFSSWLLLKFLKEFYSLIMLMKIFRCQIFCSVKLSSLKIKSTYLTKIRICVDF